MNKRFTLEKIANIVDCEHKTAPHTENGKYYLIRTSAIQNGKIDFENADRISYETYLEWTKRKLPKPGDIILAREAPVGEVGLIEEGYEVCLGQRTVLIQANNKLVCSKYLLYFLISPEAKDRFKACSTGSVVLHLNVRDIRSFALSLPPFSKQETIAHYLDTKTAQIDRKIDLLTQKATLYSNLKQSLINETVTRGLDKTVPMKDSGVKWIGEVPEHWKVTAIANITTTVSIKNYPDEELLSVYRDYGVIIKNTRDDNHNKAGQNLDSYKLVEPGYLVINKMKAWQGSLGVSEFRGIVSPAYITCRTDKRIIERGYLHHLLRCRTYINEYNRLSYGVRVDQWDMRYDDFKYVPVLLPPLSEQKTIADYLDTKTAQIDQIIQTINTQIEKLKELRKTLINDVVTGKIKVVENEH